MLFRFYVNKDKRIVFGKVRQFSLFEFLLPNFEIAIEDNRLAGSS